MRRLFALVLALACVLLPRAALAHAVGLSRGTYRLDGATLHATLTFARRDVIALLPALDADRDGSISAAELSRGKALLSRKLVDRVGARVGGVACTGRLEQARLIQQDGLVVSARYACPPGAGTLALSFGFLDALPAGHRHIADVKRGAAETEAIAFRGNETASLAPDAEPASAGPSAPAMVRMGIEHILTGIDHLVFLFGLVLVARSFRSLFKVVTAFTIGHSISLSLAALGVVTLPSSLIEPAIALSIAYVGIENFFVKSAEGRWRITLPFGLVHGFGFAGALTSIQLPHAQIPLALFSFNVGVELGQLAVLALLVPLLVLARRSAHFEGFGVKGLSGAVTLAGLAWFVLRVSPFLLAHA